MKYRVVWPLMVLALGIMVSGCGGAGKNISLAEEPGTELRTYEVFGMGCPGCHGGIEKLIKKLPGVMACRANWEKNRIIIKLNENNNVSDDDVFLVIKEANFTSGRRIN